jgi:hypothetical protein
MPPPVSLRSPASPKFVLARSALRANGGGDRIALERSTRSERRSPFRARSTLGAACAALPSSLILAISRGHAHHAERPSLSDSVPAAPVERKFRPNRANFRALDGLHGRANRRIALRCTALCVCIC